MSNKDEEKVLKEDNKPADVPFEQYQKLAYENNLLKEMILQLNVKIYFLEKQSK